MYNAFLVENDIDHIDSIFNQFLTDNFDQVCSTGGVIRYENGNIKCSVHKDESEGNEDESPGDKVPWL